MFDPAHAARITTRFLLRFAATQPDQRSPACLGRRQTASDELSDLLINMKPQLFFEFRFDAGPAEQPSGTSA